RFAIWGPVNCGSGFSMAADIYGPGGQHLTSFVSGGCSYENGAAATLMLTNSGTYTILVHETGYRSAGVYSLSIQSLTGGGCAGPTISCGQTVSGATSQDSQMNSYGLGIGGGTIIFGFSGFS